MAKLLHVTFRFPDQDVDLKVLEPVFDRAKDWIRYAPNCWMIYTDETPQVWAERLFEVTGKKNSVFVTEMGSGYGFMTKFFWDWYRKPR